MDTIYLDPTAWDLTLDASGNIARASNPYALAQDAASAIRTFLGEVYYNTLLGVPYFTEILGHLPPLPLLKQRLVDAALTVPEVIAAQVFIASITDREVKGQVQITDKAGVIQAVNF